MFLINTTDKITYRRLGIYYKAFCEFCDLAKIQVLLVLNRGTNRQYTIYIKIFTILATDLVHLRIVSMHIVSRYLHIINMHSEQIFQITNMVYFCCEQIYFFLLKSC